MSTLALSTSGIPAYSSDAYAYHASRLSSCRPFSPVVSGYGPEALPTIATPPSSSSRQFPDLSSLRTTLPSSPSSSAGGRWAVLSHWHDCYPFPSPRWGRPQRLSSSPTLSPSVYPPQHTPSFFPSFTSPSPHTPRQSSRLRLEPVSHPDDLDDCSPPFSSLVAPSSAATSRTASPVDYFNFPVPPSHYVVRPAKRTGVPSPTSARSPAPSHDLDHLDHDRDDAEAFLQVVCSLIRDEDFDGDMEEWDGAGGEMEWE
ncbi:hypothetical protein JCM10207_008802 [Rhodosporidiobolus poonsookiae]